MAFVNLFDHKLLVLIARYGCDIALQDALTIAPEKSVFDMCRGYHEPIVLFVHSVELAILSWMVCDTSIILLLLSYIWAVQVEHVAASRQGLDDFSVFLIGENLTQRVDLLVQVALAENAI